MTDMKVGDGLDKVNKLIETPELVAVPTLSICHDASAPEQLVTMILAFLETVTGTVWEGASEGTEFETKDGWLTRRVSLAFRIPSEKVIDEFKDPA